MTENIEVKDNKRIHSFDIARTFAILCVVLCHSVEVAYSNIDTMLISNNSQIIRIILFTIGRLGVPIFLFLTGALILKKQIKDDEGVIKFYKNNLLPLLITVEIWNVLYTLYNFILNKTFDLENLIKSLLFLDRVDMPNMWYMPMILGMYIATPFIAKLVKTFSIKTIKVPMIIVFVASILLQSINVIFSILKIENYSVILDLGFLGGCFGLYILLGYYISKGLLKKYKNSIIILEATIMFIITCCIQYLAYKNNVYYNVWYDFVTLFFCTVCIFELFTRIKIEKYKKTIKFTEYIAKISLGIFFVHEIFLNILIRFTEKFKINNFIEIITLFILSFGLSTISILIFSKNKFVKEKVFFIKD